MVRFHHRREVVGPPIRHQQEEVVQLLVTFALFMILEDAQKLIWGVQPVQNDTAPIA